MTITDTTQPAQFLLGMLVVIREKSLSRRQRIAFAAARTLALGQEVDPASLDVMVEVARAWGWEEIP